MGGDAGSVTYLLFPVSSVQANVAGIATICPQITTDSERANSLVFKGLMANRCIKGVGLGTPTRADRGAFSSLKHLENFSVPGRNTNISLDGSAVPVEMSIDKLTYCKMLATFFPSSFTESG